MKRILTALITVTVILSGTALVDRYYRPVAAGNGETFLSFPGQTTEREVLNLEKDQQKKLLALLNRGSDETLNEVVGIAENRSKAIRKARPFKAIEDVRSVRGIGQRTFVNIVAHADNSL